MVKIMHFFFNASHSDVTFIDFNALIRPVRFRIFPLITSQFDVDTIIGVIFVLASEVDPSRDAVCQGAILQSDLDLDCTVLLDLLIDVANP